EEFEDEEDIELTEFEDEVDLWILHELRRIGLDTARSVLELGKKELVRRSDLEEETIDHVLEIFKREFE
ncbi:MAG: transcription termination/antitermination protein NusA, partial [Bacteroidota bacterium]